VGTFILAIGNEINNNSNSEVRVMNFVKHVITSVTICGSTFGFLLC
jgi:hypothetical protein